MCVGKCGRQGHGAAHSAACRAPPAWASCDAYSFAGAGYVRWRRRSAARPAPSLPRQPAARRLWRRPGTPPQRQRAPRAPDPPPPQQHHQPQKGSGRAAPATAPAPRGQPGRQQAPAAEGAWPAQGVANQRRWACSGTAWQSSSSGSWRRCATTAGTRCALSFFLCVCGGVGVGRERRITYH